MIIRWQSPRRRCLVMAELPIRPWRCCRYMCNGSPNSLLLELYSVLKLAPSESDSQLRGAYYGALQFEGSSFIVNVACGE